MNDRISEIVHKPWFVPTVVGIATFAGGFAAGFWFGSQREIVYEPEEEVEAAEEQLDFKFEAREQDGLDLITDPVFREEVKASRERVRERDAKEKETVIVSEVPPEEPLPPDHPGFATDPDDWDYDIELKLRDPEKPYVIHRDEFWGEELGYDQSSLTYYEGDDVLTDSNNMPIYGYEAVVGELRFGHGSGDPNVFFVRNHAHDAEYEIIRDPSTYTKEVLGLEAEESADREDLRHSLRKFRPQDD